MRCPFCSASEDRVVDTRPSDSDQVIRRRRECATCLRRFTTYERVELEMPMIVKKDGRREPYDRAKLLHGLKKACEKRPVPVEALEKEVEHIERALQDLGDKEVSASRIGDAVLGALRRLDEVAYLRFASVYLSFNDLGDLMDEVQRIMALPRSSAESLEGQSARKAAPSPSAPGPVTPTSGRSDDDGAESQGGVDRDSRDDRDPILRQG